MGNFDASERWLIKKWLKKTHIVSPDFPRFSSYSVPRFSSPDFPDFPDFPTIGLHFADIQRLLDVLMRLVDMGNTMVVIEHNLDVIKCADYVIDMGPEGGPGGGQIIASGTVEEIARADKSATGGFLKKMLSA